MTEPPRPGPPGVPRRDWDPADAWVEAPDGSRYWGRHGAAGLLLWHESDVVLLQLRAAWGHHGGTWGLPGGARRAGESALDGALRESAEEAAVPADAVEPITEHVLDLDVWSYRTIVARATRWFEPRVADAESVEVRWMPVADVPALPLHPAFATAWPTLATALPRPADR